MSNSAAQSTLIINADDFGLSERDNQAILASFEQSVITSATLMANMPFFVQACQLAKTHKIDKQLGLHFNLTYGKPLSRDISLIDCICNSDGEFDFNIPRHSLFLSKNITAAIYQELEQQWQACLANGITPTHIDSHQHVHNLMPVARVVAAFARKKAVPVRLARNIGKNISALKSVFKFFLNWQITRQAKTSVRYTCTPRDLLDGLKPVGVIEIICHPKRLADGRLGDDYLPDDIALHDVIAAAYPTAAKISYGELSQ